MILVTGATGTIGRHLVPLLLADGHDVRAMTRDRARIEPRSGLEIVEADYDDPGSLQAAVRGVDAVFLVTASSSVRHDAAMVEAAAGLRVVKLSAIGTGARVGSAVLGALHLAAEQLVRERTRWTILRPSVFASNSLHWRDEVPNATGDAGSAVIDPRDVAAVAAVVLGSSAYEHRILTLTGPRALSVPDQAGLIGKVRGRSLTVREWEPEVEEWRLGAAWTRAGHNAVVTGDVEEVLGRPPHSYEDWLSSVPADGW
ncbi:NAD(P)H-binding protein [Winogradskya consettensis]|uniref:Nucleotide-diphosphate-sugar epimerase n=1 Tax=Winogradskya consettensis TaxID=113560 RepID=A0A919VYN4_9ACTN|nr:NAD(P)H-binding protein [Actinoplanes consettensis]GIM79630.1 nucleotide-diphosphate-sugar epimerase [Actinoplanes consettensis]